MAARMRQDWWFLQWEHGADACNAEKAAYVHNLGKALRLPRQPAEILGHSVNTPACPASRPPPHRQGKKARRTTAARAAVVRRGVPGKGRYSFTAPAVLFMMRFWKMKKTIATGTVINSAAASLSGYWVPWLSCPDASCATPFVRVVSSGL